MHPEDRVDVHAILAEAQNDNRARSFELRIRHQNGTWRVLEAIGRRFSMDSAKPGFVLNSRDITERKHAEEALRQANETLGAVIETSPLAIYTLDLDDAGADLEHRRGADLRVHRAGRGRQPLPILFAEDLPAFREQIEHVGQGEVGGRRRRPAPAQGRLGGRGQHLDSAAAEWHRLDRRLVAIVADNTDRRRLEEQFRQAQKMEAVGRLAGGIAHDFNNLLTVITGYCQMLLDRLEPVDPTYEDMQQVLKAADRATTLTKQLLAFSRKQIVQPKVIDLRTLIHDMDHILKRLVGEDIELHISSTAQTSGKVRVDPGQIEQVMVNLAVNARDAMPRGGRLTIEMQNLDIDDRMVARHLTMETGPYVLLAISDTGVGIPTGNAGRTCSNPSSPPKKRAAARDSGLSTSYGIVKQNRGEIVVYSEARHRHHVQDLPAPDRGAARCRLRARTETRARPAAPRPS